MEKHHCCSPSRCPLHLSRRGFLKGLGVSAVAAKIGLFDFASELMGQETRPAAATKPKVLAAFVRPNVDSYYMGWPGAAYDIKARQAQYTDILRKTAEKGGVELEIAQEPIHNDATLASWMDKAKQAAPDGVLLTCMSLNSGWKQINDFLAKRGALPTVVFSPMGTSFTGQLQPSRKATNCFVAATQDVEWLAQGLRMLAASWRMRNAHICILRGDKAEDKVLDGLGTTIHYLPRARFPEELAKVQQAEEAKAIADYYAKEAQKIVEPSRDDLLNAAENYVACRRIMAAEKCQAISMDCLGLIGSNQIPSPPCIAFSRLLDEGAVGTCECDTTSCLSQLLTAFLFDRPGFMQDPAPNTVNNTLMAAHCTCGTKLAGFDQPHAPFVLRSHSESNKGVSPQVLWPKDERVTHMKFTSPTRMILGAGKMLRNIDTPPSGGCRTSIECTVDGVADCRDVKGFHQLVILGDLENGFKAYAQLAGIQVEHI